MNKKSLPLIVLLIVVVVFLAGLKLTQGKNQKTGATPTPTPPKQTEATPTEAPKYPVTLGNFSVTDQEICQEKGKPIIYFFGSSTCHHCLWEKPIIEKVTKKFGTEIVFNEKIDFSSDPVYEKYIDIAQGYVPFIVLGCNYARLGGGENLANDSKEAEKLEEEALTVIICKLTESKPASVCEPLKEKISEIK